MPKLVEFADFISATRDVKVTPPSTLLSEATKNTYFMGTMWQGHSEKDVFRGGKNLTERIQGVDAGNFGFYSPNDELSPNQQDTLKEVAVPWAFGQSHYVFTEETIGLNEGDTNAYVELKKSYEKQTVIDIVNGMEEALWADPNYDTMELASADPKIPYSIPCFVTQDGEVPASGNGGIASGSTAWTNIETLPPGTNTWWKNKSANYTAGSEDDPDSGLLATFDDIVLQVGFDMPTGIPGQMWSDNETKRRQCFVTNRDGIVFYKSRLRQANDRMDSLKDPGIRGPQFEGIPIKYAAELDNAGWTANQPDYFCLNFSFLFPYMRSGWFMKEKLTDGGAKQPNTHVVYKFVHYNLFCRSRRRQGRVSAS